MIVYVKKHFAGFTPTVQGIFTDEDNKVEELEYCLRLEDAAWFTLEGKWVVLNPRMKIKELEHILMGDGKTPETCFEAKFRVGGVIIDVFNFFASGVYKAVSYVIPRKPEPKSEKSIC